MEEEEACLLGREGSTRSERKKSRPMRFPTAAESLWSTASAKKLRRPRGMFHKMKSLNCPSVLCFLDDNKENKMQDMHTFHAQMSYDSSNIGAMSSDLDQTLDDRILSSSEPTQRGMLGDTGFKSSIPQFSPSSASVKSMENSFRIQELDGSTNSSPGRIILGTSSSSFTWDPPFPDPSSDLQQKIMDTTKEDATNGSVVTTEESLTTSSSPEVDGDEKEDVVAFTVPNAPQNKSDDVEELLNNSTMRRRNGSLRLSPLVTTSKTLETQSSPRSPATVFEDISWASSSSTAKAGQKQKSTKSTFTAEELTMFPFDQNVFKDTNTHASAEQPQGSSSSDTAGNEQKSESLPQADLLGANNVSLDTQESTPFNPFEEENDDAQSQEKSPVESAALFLPVENAEHPNRDAIPKYEAVPPINPSRRRRGGQFIPLPCICRQGKACTGVSAAFHMLEDPRGGFTMVPKKQLVRTDADTEHDIVMDRLRECFLTSLLPEDEAAFVDSAERQYVANHHFHPDLVAWSPTGHQCEIPMLVSAREADILRLEMEDEHRIPGEKQMPTIGYYVMPNYTFEQTVVDLRLRIKVQKIVGEKKSSKRKKKRNRSSEGPSSTGTPKDTVADQSAVALNVSLPAVESLPFEEKIQSEQPVACDDAGFPIQSEPSRIEKLRMNKQASLDKFNMLSSHLSETLKSDKLNDGTQSSAEGTGSDRSVEENEGHFPTTANHVVTATGPNPSGEEEGQSSTPSDDKLNENGEMTDFQLSLPPRPATLNLDVEERVEMQEKLSAFESQRRSEYALKLTDSNEKWRSSLDGFEEGLNQTASAEHWVYEASNATQSIAQDALLSDKGHGSSDTSGDDNSDSCDDQSGAFPVLSGYLSSCIAEELSRARPELEAKVAEMEQRGISILAEMESAEAKVNETWDMYNAVAVVPSGRHESDATSTSSPDRSEGSPPSTDLWAVQMRYRIAVANQSLEWKRSSTKLSKLFETVDEAEKERRDWLRGLLVEVVSRTPISEATQFPVDKINEIIQAISESHDSETPIKSNTSKKIQATPLPAAAGTESVVDETKAPPQEGSASQETEASTRPETSGSALEGAESPPSAEANDVVSEDGSSVSLEIAELDARGAEEDEQPMQLSASMAEI